MSPKANGMLPGRLFIGMHKQILQVRMLKCLISVSMRVRTIIIREGVNKRGHYISTLLAMEPSTNAPSLLGFHIGCIYRSPRFLLDLHV